MLPRPRAVERQRWRRAERLPHTPRRSVTGNCCLAFRGLGRPVDAHPQLCDTCKHVAVAAAHDTDQQEQPEPLPDWAQRKRFLCFTSRPRCTECKAAFTDERWQAVERTGWGPFLRNATRRCARPAPRSTTTASRTTGQTAAPASSRRSGRSRGRCPNRSPADGSLACAPDPGKRQAWHNLQDPAPQRLKRPPETRE